MLNKYKEHYDYTKDLKLVVTAKNVISTNTNIYGRLMHNSSIKRYGLRRAFTLIARRFLYHDLEDVNNIVTLTDDKKSIRI